MAPKRQSEGASASAVPVRTERTRTIAVGGAAGTSASVVRTRGAQLRTRPIYARQVDAAAAVETYGGHVSVVARRSRQVARRRARALLVVLGVLLAFFPPMWAVYLIAWLVWRNRPHNRSMRQVRKAVRALEKEQTGIALKRLQEAHLQDPSNGDALYWLGLLLAEQGRPQEAIEALSLLAERAPGLPEVEQALLESYYVLGDYENAVHHAQRVLDLDPYNLPVLVQLADCFEALGQPALAIEMLQHAPLYKRTLDESLKLVHFRLAELYERQGDAERALAHYRRVYASDASYPNVEERLRALETAGT